MHRSRLQIDEKWQVLKLGHGHSFQRWPPPPTRSSSAQPYARHRRARQLAFHLPQTPSMPISADKLETARRHMKRYRELLSQGK